MIIANGTTGVSTYFVLRDSTNHAPKTNITVTDIDLYYVEELAAISAAIDATALAAADSAYTSGGAFHVGYGLYRIDWPDAAFDGGAGKKVQLIVVCTGVDNAYLEVELSPVISTSLDTTQTWDGVSTLKLFNAMVAMLAGKVEVTDNGATRTLSFKKQNGTDESFTVTVAEADGARAATGSIS